MCIRDRLYEELGIRCDLQFLFKFQYQAQFDATGAEHELCSVFIGRCDEPVRINRDEIAEWRWASPVSYTHLRAPSASPPSWENGSTSVAASRTMRAQTNTRTLK